MRCEVARELLPLHVGDDLPLPQAHRLEEHLEHCLLCAADYAVYADARADLLTLAEEMPAPGSLWEGVSRAVAASSAAATSAPAPRRRRFLGWSGLAAAAVLLVLFGPWRATDGGGAVADPGTSASSPALRAGLVSPVDDSGRPLIIEASPDDLRAFLEGGGAWQTELPLVPAAGEVLPVAEPVGANQPPPGGRRGRF